MTRPDPRPWHCQTALEDFAMVTYDVSPVDLARQLPPDITPLRFDISGGSRALVSAVMFNDHDFHFRGAPWARMNCGQVNYRAYVRRGNETGVWFFGTSLDHRLVQVTRTLWQMPWHREQVKIQARWQEAASALSAQRAELMGYSFHSPGPWGSAQVRLTSASSPVGLLPGFTSEAEQRTTLLDPFTGWYRRARDGRVGRYSVWHEPLTPLLATVGVASFAVFERAGLVAKGEAPLHAIVQRRSTFDVHTPPRQQ